MTERYEINTPPERHPRATRRRAAGQLAAIAVAATVATSAATRSPWVPVLAVALLVVTVLAVTVVAPSSGVTDDDCIVRRRAGLALAVVVLGLVAGQRSAQAWASLEPDHLGPFEGWATVVDEPQRYAGATRLLLEIDGERFELWVRGRARQLRAIEWRGGQLVTVAGERTALDDERATRVAWQHVVGEFEATWLGDVAAGGPLARSSNRVREVIERGASALEADQAALARGLVIGDDRDQPEEMIDRFRASGLAHLTAVSGQNVAFVLAAAGPLLRRAPPVGRWALSLLLIAWFVVLTRAEPSVLRAGTMAGLSATAFAFGRQREPVRILALAVTGLVLVDPLLVWSVGFWLSVGATAGVTTIGPWLAVRLRRLGPLATPVAITIGAQLGVATPSVLVFGHLSLIGTVANLVAVPVAGFVMLFGLPACLLAGALPVVAPVVMAPVGWAVRWVDAVATVGAHGEPTPPWSWFGWAALAVAVVWLAVTAPAPARQS